MIDTERPVVASSRPPMGLNLWDQLPKYWPIVASVGAVVVAIVVGGLSMSHSSTEKHRETAGRLAAVEAHLKVLSAGQTLLHEAIQNDLQDLEEKLDTLERKRRVTERALRGLKEGSPAPGNPRLPGASAGP